MAAGLTGAAAGDAFRMSMSASTRVGISDGVAAASPGESDAESWRWCGEFDACDRAPKRARASVAAACGSRFDAATMIDVQLVVSELVTNCIEHAGAERIRLCLRSVGDGIVVSVASATPVDGVPEPSDWRLPATTSCTGRGLAMIGRIGRPAIDRPDADLAADPGWSGITVAIQPHLR